jgi:hypothetical protein
LRTRLRNNRKINEEFILRIVGYEETLKRQDADIKYLISKQEDQIKLYEDIISKISNCEKNLEIEFQKKNTIIYVLFCFFI